MGRKSKKRYRIGRYVLGLLVLVGVTAGGWAWWEHIHWRPARDAYPVQGVLIGKRDKQPDFRALKAVGADFAYLEASHSESGLDPDFSSNLAAAIAADLQVGAVHFFSPCVAAERQAANFVTVVPRDDRLLPPVIALDETAKICSEQVHDAAVESELTVFLNQIEGHAGKAALLKISPQFEQDYLISSRLDRNLWLERERWVPEYTNRPWAIWTANSHYRSPASGGSLRWLAVQP